MNSTNKYFLNKFFKSLLHNKIDYCILRNYELLPNSLNGSDLDILIHRDDIEEFYFVLNQVLEETNGKIIIKYGKLTPRVCISGVIDDKMYGIQLDVHEGILPYKHVAMFPENLILRDKKLYNNLYVADNNHSNIVAFLKEILNNSSCKRSYFDDAKISWSINERTYITILKDIYTKQFVELFNFTLRNKYSSDNIKDLSNLGRKILLKGFSNQIKLINNYLYKIYRFKYPVGYTVAFLGVDGSGKTTIINHIKEPLGEAVHNSLYYEHKRPNLILNIAQLFGRDIKQENINNPHLSKSSGRVGSILRFSYYLLDYIFGYWIKVYPIKVKKSSIWIFDRYYYDYCIDLKRGKINLPKWFFKFMLFFIPEPDLIICLGGNPESIYKRKKELPLEEIRQQVDRLKEFSTIHKRAIWINSDIELNISVKNVFNVIIDRMSDRSFR